LKAGENVERRTSNVECLNEETVVVCSAVRDQARPVLGSIQRQCTSCGCGIWVSPSTRANLPTLRGAVRLVCGRCAVPLISSDPRPELLPLEQNQIDEVRAEFERRRAYTS
jgi:hypothetical protein